VLRVELDSAEMAFDRYLLKSGAIDARDENAVREDDHRRHQALGSLADAVPDPLWTDAETDRLARRRGAAGEGDDRIDHLEVF